MVPGISVVGANGISTDDSARDIPAIGSICDIDIPAVGSARKIPPVDSARELPAVGVTWDSFAIEIPL